jgi:hypothetical protein
MITGEADVTISIGTTPQQVGVSPAAGLCSVLQAVPGSRGAAKQGLRGSDYQHVAGVAAGAATRLELPEIDSSRLHELPSPCPDACLVLCLHLQQQATPYWASAHPIKDYVRVDDSVSIYYEVHGLPQGG